MCQLIFEIKGVAHIISLSVAFPWNYDNITIFLGQILYYFIQKQYFNQNNEDPRFYNFLPYFITIKRRKGRPAWNERDWLDISFKITIITWHKNQNKVNHFSEQISNQLVFCFFFFNINFQRNFEGAYHKKLIISKLFFFF